MKQKNEARCRLPKYFNKYSKELKQLDEDTFRKRMYADMGTHQTWIVAGCFHFPFHNEKLFQSFLKLIRYLGQRLDGIVINGDYLDLMALSTHARGENILPGITLEVEYSSGLDGLMDIQAACSHKGVVKKFNWGNHEDRYKRHMNKSDNAKYGSALLSPTEALNLHELGYEVNEDWKDGYFTLGKDLQVFHGVYTCIHAAKKHLEMYQSSCIFDHTHREQVYSNSIGHAYNIGTMCDIDSKAFKYMPRSQRMQWRNAFAVVKIDDDGDHFVETIRPKNDKFIFEGNVF
jgi:hypothetical protein